MNPAPAAAARVAQMPVGREYTAKQLKEQFDIYSDILTRAMRHRLLLRARPVGSRAFVYWRPE